MKTCLTDTWAGPDDGSDPTREDFATTSAIRGVFNDVHLYMKFFLNETSEPRVLHLLAPCNPTLRARPRGSSSTRAFADLYGFSSVVGLDSGFFFLGAR